MTRPLPLIALALLLGLPAPPVAAAPAVGAMAEGRVQASPLSAAAPDGAPVVLAQYYAPPRYRRPHRRCWTTTQRIVQVDRWGRPHVRYVPRRVCAYR